MLCITLISFSSVASGDLSSEDLGTEMMFAVVLDEYFNQREQAYLNENPSFDTERNLHIQEWAENLAIQIRDAEVQYTIVDVLQDTDEMTKVEVYEWTWIYYTWVGEDTIRTMGFEITHIMRVSKGSLNAQIMSDSYIDMVTNYEAGTESDLTALHARYSGDNDISQNVAPALVVPEMTINRNYNPAAAVAYSYQWCGTTLGVGDTNPAGYNPAYYHIIDEDGGSLDCCNFVSQCLHEAGMPTNEDWYVTKNTSGVVTADYGGHSSYAWQNTQEFHNKWCERGYVSLRLTSATKAIPGNPIYWLKRDGNDYNHNMLIVGVGPEGQVEVNGHNPNMRGCLFDLSRYTFYTIDFVHALSTSSNATTHTQICSVCNTSLTEEHVFVMEDGIPTCSICGYH